MKTRISPRSSVRSSRSGRYCAEILIRCCCDRSRCFWLLDRVRVPEPGKICHLSRLPRTGKLSFEFRRRISNPACWVWTAREIFAMGKRFATKMVGRPWNDTTRDANLAFGRSLGGTTFGLLYFQYGARFEEIGSAHRNSQEFRAQASFPTNASWPRG